MSSKFFERLSQNYIEILSDDEYYDVTIEVGNDPNVKIFRAHRIILCYRSSFLRRTLVSNKKNNDGTVAHIKLPNISSEIFQIILEYIYGGVISLNEHEPLEILKVLTAADELLLQELINYLQEYLIENKFEWIEQNFEYTHRISFQTNSLLKLQQFCTGFMAKSPKKIFESLDFTLLPENSLISLIKRNDLQMKEIEIWDHVLKWGLAQNSTLIPDPDTWTDNDFKVMENTLQHCLPLIRFFSLSSEMFVQKVHPYRKLLKPQLYDELFKSYLDPNAEPSNNILLPRCKNIDGIIDSKILNLYIASLISRWIDKIDIKSKYAYTRELYLPYNFQLLLRGSRDGFTPKNFHELCDDIPHTVTLIKVKGTGEILGGYNPLVWKSHNDGDYGKTKDSFIFSFKGENNFRDIVLSHVNNTDCALIYHNSCGPAFSSDLSLYVKEKDGLKRYNCYECKRYCYEKRIRDTRDEFLIEDYEVFQIIKKHDD
ncbi:uncharacterized protein OCT59_029096 [Rhizophagus irregularis]|uniref:Serine-enriched protein n=2 Tax=Rhizophagus irregularis TaxID=588596 RepID=A0A015IHQ8_RHIIW|nr:hypothetical protein RirG_213660 [Rhizophagus irregularis DAOM 197198w]UZO08851.1 hypothetical protein OCT59_029096 [Rhizophagus irregularis]